MCGIEGDLDAKKEKEKTLKFLKKGVDILVSMVYNIEVVRRKALRNKYAAIAQSVERILGKDEVSSSNLDSSSKPLIFQ